MSVEQVIEKPPVTQIPELEDRFRTAPVTLFWDRFMNRFIKTGGIGIIVAVLGIFVFILSQILPLFQSAKVAEQKTMSIQPQSNVIALGVDEWAERPFVLTGSGEVHFYSWTNAKSPQIESIDTEDQTISAVSYHEKLQKIILGFETGDFQIVDITYSPKFSGNQRSIEASIQSNPIFNLGSGKVLEINCGQSHDKILITGILESDSKKEIHLTTLTRETSLFGSGEYEEEASFDLTEEVLGEPTKLLVSQQADTLLIATQEGEIYYFQQKNQKTELRQVFSPFQNEKNKTIASMDYLLGDSSVVLTNPDGLNRIYSIHVTSESDDRVFEQTKEFPSLSRGASFYSQSLRNKAFLIGAGNYASLRYATTETVRWQADLPFQIANAVIGRKYKNVLFLDTDNQMHLYRLDDPHPEAGFKAFFSKIWYEGYSEPSYQWQSTGGSDDFESKLSLIPLIVGSLKGTFYAMLFALPLALLAAMYTSEFAHYKVKVTVKPVMEVMASLPSVVLGFLAALWLAPLIEHQVPAILLMLVALPCSAIVLGAIWGNMPIQQRKWLPNGFEWIILVPALFGVSYACWIVGPMIERVLFVTTDPNTGLRVADFRLWWPQVTGTPFEQRNALVVGFVMGFAVIPIIFTIAEDALSNVPRALRSASMALGASRWQTAMRVILPTATAGIFSAIMIGFARAVGETMIVVMATGNTPILSWNIFNGMRTLSANIAVELPEAPHHSTLYRTLFLGAMVLFVLTFVINTFAEILRQHFREKYKTV